ncbi:hypothetical protein J6590_033106 [Homalodisca vitripennis]|nr:hypothetical protein J6590_033106 [Homalodisca vitripennis]
MLGAEGSHYEGINLKSIRPLSPFRAFRPTLRWSAICQVNTCSMCSPWPLSPPTNRPRTGGLQKFFYDFCQGTSLLAKIIAAFPSWNWWPLVLASGHNRVVVGMPIQKELGGETYI